MYELKEKLKQQNSNDVRQNKPDVKHTKDCQSGALDSTFSANHIAEGQLGTTQAKDQQKEVFTSQFEKTFLNRPEFVPRRK